MAATPPTSRFPTWATDGGADVTDPGSSKQATGWVEGEAPAADHTNWLHNARGEWLSYLRTIAAPYVVLQPERATAPWSTTTTTQRTIQWIESVSRWYSITTDGTNSYVCDSADGVTWSSEKTLTGASVGALNIASDGTGIWVAEHQSADIWVSATSASSGLSAITANFNNITDIAQGAVFFWPGTDEWFVWGLNGTTLYLESLPKGDDPAVDTWTSETSFSTTQFTRWGALSSGGTLIREGGGGPEGAAFHIPTSTATDFSYPATQSGVLIWSETLGRFIGCNSTGDDVWVNTSAESAPSTWTNVGYNGGSGTAWNFPYPVDQFIDVGGQFLLAFEEGPDGRVIMVTGINSDHQLSWTELGTLNSLPQAASSNYFFLGSSDQIIWSGEFTTGDEDLVRFSF